MALRVRMVFLVHLARMDSLGQLGLPATQVRQELLAVQDQRDLLGHPATLVPQAKMVTTAAQDQSDPKDPPATLGPPVNQAVLTAHQWQRTSLLMVDITVEELLTSLSPHPSIIVPLFLLATAVHTTVNQFLITDHL